jgi:hypothetical protein
LEHYLVRKTFDLHALEALVCAGDNLGDVFGALIRTLHDAVSEVLLNHSSGERVLLQEQEPARSLDIRKRIGRGLRQQIVPMATHYGELQISDKFVVI